AVRGSSASDYRLELSEEWASDLPFVSVHLSCEGCDRFGAQSEFLSRREVAAPLRRSRPALQPCDQPVPGIRTPLTLSRRPAIPAWSSQAALNWQQRAANCTGISRHLIPNILRIRFCASGVV